MILCGLKVDFHLKRTSFHIEGDDRVERGQFVLLQFCLVCFSFVKQESVVSNESSH